MENRNRNKSGSTFVGTFIDVPKNNGKGKLPYKQLDAEFKFLKKLRDAHVENNFSCHKFCGQCPDWKQTRWPGEGGRYANIVDQLKRQGGDSSMNYRSQLYSQLFGG